jgi:parallel beta-helix repeat protein
MNRIDSNEHGIRLDSSGDNNLTFNEMTNNFYNFGVTGTEIDHYPQEINTSNEVDSAPIYYWVGVNASAVPSSAGYVGLISCSNITVPNVTIHNNYQGILLVNTTYSTMQNVTVNWTYHGAYLFLSSNDTIEGYGSNRSLFDNNTIGVRMHMTSHTTVNHTDFTNNSDAGIYITGTLSYPAIWNNISRVYAGYTAWYGFGIRLEYAKTTTISNSTIDHCGRGIYITGDAYGLGQGVWDTNNMVIFTNITESYQNGVSILYAKHNLVVNNSFYQNELGIYVRYSAQYNVIYHNNFQENTDNYSVDGRWIHTWDNDYTSPIWKGGGNWWDDFPCDDDFSGPGQDVPGFDGICDTSHTITNAPEWNVDNYPLKNPAIVGPRPE